MSYPPQPSPYGGPTAVGTSQKAIWSLVSGIAGILCCPVFAIVAIVLSSMAKKDTQQTGRGGGGMATAGMVLGVIGLVWLVISIILISTGVINVNFHTSTSSGS